MFPETDHPTLYDFASAGVTDVDLILVSFGVLVLGLGYVTLGQEEQ